MVGTVEVAKVVVLRAKAEESTEEEDNSEVVQPVEALVEVVEKEVQMVEVEEMKEM